MRGFQCNALEKCKLGKGWKEIRRLLWPALLGKNIILGFTLHNVCPHEKQDLLLRSRMRWRPWHLCFKISNWYRSRRYQMLQRLTSSALSELTVYPACLFPRREDLVCGVCFLIYSQLLCLFHVRILIVSSVAGSSVSQRRRWFSFDKQKLYASSQKQYCWSTVQ